MAKWQTFVAHNRWAILLGLMLCVFVLDGVNGELWWADLSLTLMTTAIFLGVMSAVEHKRRFDILAIALILSYALLGTINEARHQAWMDNALLVVNGLLLIGGMLVVTIQLFRPAVSERERLCSAVFGFLLLTIIWALIYWRVENALPGSFNLTPYDTSGSSSPFVYFSAVTITTLGYGEITPANSFARSLTALEAIAGTLYIAVLIGQIVGRLK